MLLLVAVGLQEVVNLTCIAKIKKLSMPMPISNQKQRLAKT